MNIDDDMAGKCWKVNGTLKHLCLASSDYGAVLVIKNLPTVDWTFSLSVA